MALTVMFQTNCDHVIKPSTIDYIHIVAVSVSFYVYLLIFGYEMKNWTAGATCILEK